MLKAIRLTLITLALSILIPWTTVTAQDNALVDVEISTFPRGVSVSVDGKELGNTPLNTKLSSGTHTFRFNLPGFLDKVETRQIQGASTSVSVDLDAGSDFALLPSEPNGITWAGSGEQVRFVVTDYKGARPTETAITYDLNKRTSATNTPPVDTLEDVSLSSRLGASSRLYKSPSGRYVGFASKETSTLTITDTQANRTLKSELRLPATTGALNPPFQLVWSANETVVWVNRPGMIMLAEFAVLEGEAVKPIYVQGFKSATNTGEYISHIWWALGRPSDQKLTLILAREQGPLIPWLVDLQSMTGTPLPIEGIYDAGFTPDGKAICVVHKGGISRLSLDLKNVVLVSNIVSERWGVLKVSLSPTLNYAIIGAGSTESAAFWIYKMPKC